MSEENKILDEGSVGDESLVEAMGSDTNSPVMDDENQLLREELSQLNDKYLRLGAEFDNYRKRTLREKQSLLSSAASSTLESLLPIVDDLERAVQSIEDTTSVEAIAAGLKLVEKKMRKFMEDSGVHEIQSEGLELNTDFHEAITTIPAPTDDLKGHIVGVVRKGYTLNGHVIRHAQVVIGE